jgi:hypothetical protein
MSSEEEPVSGWNGSLCQVLDDQPQVFNPINQSINRSNFVCLFFLSNKNQL